MIASCRSAEAVNMGEPVRLRDLADYIAQAEKQMACERRRG